MSSEFPRVVTTRPPRVPQPSGGGFRSIPRGAPGRGAERLLPRPSAAPRSPAGSAPARSSAPRSPAGSAPAASRLRCPAGADARAAGGCGGPG